MREDHDQALEAETAKEKQKWAESIRYQEELEKQLIEQEKQKQKAYEEFLKEKLMIDEIVRKIYEEDQRWGVFSCHSPDLVWVSFFSTCQDDSGCTH